MNIVKTGLISHIYGEDIETYKLLPKGVYEVGFSKNTGFFLVDHPSLAINDSKVYGSAEKKIDKVIKSYNLTNRNFGIILSGQKGSGKSLFARLLSSKLELPTIIVNRYIGGIAEFLSEIQQPVMVLFDEFEKKFKDTEDEHPQIEMLSLFDGIDNGKKLFVITCNNPKELNEYLRNRPGRFHYHFRMGTLEIEDIQEYLSDCLLEQYQNVISSVCKLSYTVDLTYDILRALVFEINQGNGFEEIIKDLNIERKENVAVDCTVLLENGDRFIYNGIATMPVNTTDNWRLGLNPNEETWKRVPSLKRTALCLNINPSHLVYEDSYIKVNLSEISKHKDIFMDIDYSASEEDEEIINAYFDKMIIQDIIFEIKKISPLALV